jgi:hypothetical protein
MKWSAGTMPDKQEIFDKSADLLIDIIERMLKEEKQE